jgi:hypothetical protein
VSRPPRSSSDSLLRRIVRTLGGGTTVRCQPSLTEDHRDGLSVLKSPSSRVVTPRYIGDKRGLPVSAILPPIGQRDTLDAEPKAGLLSEKVFDIATLFGGDPSKPIVAVSRRPNQLDIFVVGGDGNIWTAWWAPGHDRVVRPHTDQYEQQSNPLR